MSFDKLPQLGYSALIDEVFQFESDWRRRLTQSESSCQHWQCTWLPFAAPIPDAVIYGIMDGELTSKFLKGDVCSFSAKLSAP